jgi:hypothetical protein
MKLFKAITLIGIITIAIIVAFFMFFKTCTHEVTYQGTVISHHITSDKYGDISYYTVARFNDGHIRSISGLHYYVVEVGGTVYYSVTELNK